QPRQGMQDREEPADQRQGGFLDRQVGDGGGGGGGRSAMEAAELGGSVNMGKAQIERRQAAGRRHRPLEASPSTRTPSMGRPGPW
ncbi:MAG: hypothetical protein ACK583_18035, partial [Cyanobacteriota bacterium]